MQWLMLYVQEQLVEVKIDDIIVCGKTGTVQNREDHSIFIAFAPKDI
jgi:hypothetical protein